MLTLSSLFFCVINYKFSLNNIYIASHLHVEGFMNFLKTLIFDKHKMEKLLKFECF
jgi:hypothetical protein